MERSGKGRKDAGIKELVGNRHESKRVEETSEGGQDSLRVVVMMMMMMMTPTRQLRVMKC
jgi:hypothetical protein